MSASAGAQIASVAATIAAVIKPPRRIAPEGVLTCRASMHFPLRSTGSDRPIVNWLAGILGHRLGDIAGRRSGEHRGPAER